MEDLLEKGTRCRHWPGDHHTMEGKQEHLTHTKTQTNIWELVATRLATHMVESRKGGVALASALGTKRIIMLMCGL